MSELIQKHDDRATIRWKLLTSVSAAALLVSVYTAGEAQAADNDTDRPLVWIELGGQLEQMNKSQEALSPAFMASIAQPSLLSALNVQKSPAFAIDEEGKISFQPESSDWVFSASIRYGRSSAAQHRHYQTPNLNGEMVGKDGKGGVHVRLPTLAPFLPFGNITSTNLIKYNNSRYTNFADGVARQSEAHTVLDFQAGKDVGLGLFGGRGTSVLSAGVRIAQFTSQAHATMHARPDYHMTPSKPISSFPADIAWKYAPIQFHDYTAKANTQRSFRGVGPTLAWNASLPFAGSPERGELTVDWGANAAILFGRQKVNGHHQTTTRTHSGRWANVFRIPTLSPHVNAVPVDRTRTVTVPNLGGFAGVSLQWVNAKISFGYRGDFFFGALDGGIDTRKSENRAFYGPFASISVGLGD